ncbi:MAG TPA: hypothetical protein VL335_03060 [Candidatus Paceibacterota bacterium]|nr:hypothetical protein [Candidatus Paceibacterota bacterium]
MKSIKNIVIGIIVIIIFVAVGMYLRSTSHSTPQIGGDVSAPTSEAKPGTAVAVSETTKVSGSLSEYQNAELGFSVKYPSAWEKEEANSGVNFIIPIDQSQVETVKTLQANVQAFSGTCAFPPVTTVKSRDTVKVGSNTFNMIAMNNTVKSLTYTNRMYSLQQGAVCYMFSFAAISSDPSTTGLTGSNVIQAQNNNKAITTTADADFTAMVKSFAIVTTPAGKDESTVAPVKK